MYLFPSKSGSLLVSIQMNAMFSIEAGEFCILGSNENPFILKTGVSLTPININKLYSIDREHVVRKQSQERLCYCCWCCC